MLVPQIIGGFDPALPVTLKVSVKHWVAGLVFLPPKLVEPPAFVPVENVTVLGPVMTNVLKSNRS